MKLLRNTKCLRKLKRVKRIFDERSLDSSAAFDVYLYNNILLLSSGRYGYNKVQIQISSITWGLRRKGVRVYADSSW